MASSEKDSQKSGHPSGGLDRGLAQSPKSSAEVLPSNPADSAGVSLITKATEIQGEDIEHLREELGSLRAQERQCDDDIKKAHAEIEKIVESQIKTKDLPVWRQKIVFANQEQKKQPWLLMRDLAMKRRAQVRKRIRQIEELLRAPSVAPQVDESQLTSKAQQTSATESGQGKSKTKRGRGNLADNAEFKKWFEKQLEEGKHVCELLLAGNLPEDVSGKCPEFFKDVIEVLSPARSKQFFEDTKMRKMPQEELAQYIAEVKGYKGSYLLKVR